MVSNSYHNPVPRDDAEMLSITQVSQATGFGESTIYRKSRGAGFPSPQKVWAVAQGGAKRLQLRWDAEEINAWMEKKTNPGRTGRSAPRPKNRTVVPVPKTAVPEPYNWKRELAIGLPTALLGAGALGAILGLAFPTLIRWLGAN
jgi:predicted DNA-binding transcriptional regulator AlpA